MIQNIEQIVKSLTGAQAPDWYNDLRAQGLSRFNSAGIPTVKNEEWKYTDLAPLARHSFTLAKEGRLAEPEALDRYLGSGEPCIVFVNGLLSTELSDLDRLPKDISVVTIPEALTENALNLREHLSKYNINDQAAFAALNQALNNSGVYIHVKENTAATQALHIVHVTSAGHKNLAVMPRALIVLARSAEATILESHVSFDDKAAYLANALTDIILEENATLHYCKAQKESLKAYHIGATRVWQERDSNFDGFSFMAGGKLARNDLDVVLAGEGANASLNAFYSVYNDQHVDNHTCIDHRFPHATSNQLYKGILNNKARAVFNGKVFVRPVAQKTSSYQLNKNLLLGSDCRVDTKPQLEIFADDVKCSHGATVGQLEDEEMFYLQTRGIGKKEATRMLAHGFVDDLFGTIAHAAIREKLNRLMEPSFKALG